MNDLNESILNDQKKGSGDTTNTSNETTSLTTNATIIKSSGTYVYGIHMLAVLAIGVCVFFAYYTFPKKLVNGKKDQPPERRHML